MESDGGLSHPDIAKNAVATQRRKSELARRFPNVKLVGNDYLRRLRVRYETTKEQARTLRYSPDGLPKRTVNRCGGRITR
jgi:hypothetical protein